MCLRMSITFKATATLSAKGGPHRSRHQQRPTRHSHSKPSPSRSVGIWVADSSPDEPGGEWWLMPQETTLCWGITSSRPALALDPVIHSQIHRNSRHTFNWAGELPGHKGCWGERKQQPSRDQGHPLSSQGAQAPRNRTDFSFSAFPSYLRAELSLFPSTVSIRQPLKYSNKFRNSKKN